MFSGTVCYSSTEERHGQRGLQREVNKSPGGRESHRIAKKLVASLNAWKLELKIVLITLCLHPEQGNSALAGQWRTCWRRISLNRRSGYAMHGKGNPRVQSKSG
jgi:hypothetical protein